MLTTIETKTGSTYQFDGMFAYYNGDNLGHVWVLRRIPESEIEYGIDDTEDVIARMTDCAPGDLLVGDRFYVSTGGRFRLASRVVDVYEE